MNCTADDDDDFIYPDPSLNSKLPSMIYTEKLSQTLSVPFGDPHATLLSGCAAVRYTLASAWSGFGPEVEDLEPHHTVRAHEIRGQDSPR